VDGDLADAARDHGRADAAQPQAAERARAAAGRVGGLAARRRARVVLVGRAPVARGVEPSARCRPESGCTVRGGGVGCRVGGV
jgi:hypothetical protein